QYELRRLRTIAVKIRHDREELSIVRSNLLKRLCGIVMEVWRRATHAAKRWDFEGVHAVEEGKVIGHSRDQRTATIRTLNFCHASVWILKNELSNGVARSVEFRHKHRLETRTGRQRQREELARFVESWTVMTLRAYPVLLAPKNIVRRILKKEPSPFLGL